MDEMNGVAHREHWLQVFEDWRQSGLKRETFCRERSLRLGQFRYWYEVLVLKPGRAGSAEAGGKRFARVRCSGGSGLRLTVGALSVEIDPGFDEGTLSRFLRVVASTC